MDLPLPGDLVDSETGERFHRTLVTQFAAGNHLWDKQGGQVRTVAKVEVIARIHCDSMEGEPDHLDFPVHGAEARQWGAKGVPVHGQSMTGAELDASWSHRDQAAAEDRPAYPGRR